MHHIGVLCCRIMGALISAHLLMLDPQRPFGAIRPDDYDGELLHLAHDLGARLLPAFENTVTGIPYPRVSSCHLSDTVNLSKHW